jgi:hypothetical protein
LAEEKRRRIALAEENWKFASARFEAGPSNAVAGPRSYITAIADAAARYNQESFSIR